MIIFATCASASDRVLRLTVPTIEALDEQDPDVRVLRNQTSIARAYNAVLDDARAMTAVEAVVFVHDDVRITDPAACTTLRDALAEPDVAVVGVIGGRRPTTMSWASGQPVGRVVEVDEADGSRRVVKGEPGAGTHDVDTVDGLFLAFSPWAVEHLRFDHRRFPEFDGYDADVCAQARRLGKRVLVAAIPLEHVSTAERGQAYLRSANRQASLAWSAKWRADQPRWRRAAWALRARGLPVEYRLRRIPWRT